MRPAVARTNWARASRQQQHTRPNVCIISDIARRRSRPFACCVCVCVGSVRRLAGWPLITQVANFGANFASTCKRLLALLLVVVVAAALVTALVVVVVIMSHLFVVACTSRLLFVLLLDVDCARPKQAQEEDDDDDHDHDEYDDDHDDDDDDETHTQVYHYEQSAAAATTTTGHVIINVAPFRPLAVRDVAWRPARGAPTDRAFVCPLELRNNDTVPPPSAATSSSSSAAFISCWLFVEKPQKAGNDATRERAVGIIIIMRSENCYCNIITTATVAAAAANQTKWPMTKGDLCAKI